MTPWGKKKPSLKTKSSQKTKLLRKKIHNGSSDEESSFIFSSDEREDNAWSDGDYLPPSSDDDDDGDDDENETAASTTKPTPSSRNPRRAPVPKVVTPEETYIKLKTNKRKRNDNNRKNKASAPKAKRKLDFDDSDNSEGSLHGDSKETNADDESFVVVASRSPKIRKIIRDDDIYDGLYDTDDDEATFLLLMLESGFRCSRCTLRSANAIGTCCCCLLTCRLLN